MYLLDAAKTGRLRRTEWNSLDIEARNDVIRVRVNGDLVSQHPGEAGRSKTGPIGLQLHDRFSTILFRNIRIRELVPGR